jgi:NAD(P)-dependent dehydrogenase (short-subunit alcohol dehydrogenase family)
VLAKAGWASEVDSMKIRDSIAFVTGANRGLGKELVAALVERGARKVYAAARDGGAIALPSGDAARVVVPVELDVTRAEHVAELGRRAPELTLLFNNAGVLASGNLLTTDRASLERDLATNFFGSLEVTKGLLPSLRRGAASAGRAAVVNVLTIASFASMPALGGYAASKAAAFSMTQALRAELAPGGIDVHAAFPGPIDTDMIRDFKLPKTGPSAVAGAILDGVERGDHDIGPDPMSEEILRVWRQDPKEIERRFASFGG